MNRLNEIIDGRAHTLSYTSFNARGLVEYTGHPNTNNNDFVFRTFQYNASAQVTEQTEYFFSNGNVTGPLNQLVKMNFAYNDPDGLLSQIAYPQQPSRNVDFQYDAYGRLARVDDATGWRQFTHNDADMLETERTRYKAQGGFPAIPVQVMRYFYNPDGSLKRLDTPAGDFRYDYDNVGRLTKLTNPMSEITRWQYQPNGWLKNQILANGIRSLYLFDEQGRLMRLTNRWTDIDNDPNLLLSRFTVPVGGYDAAGNRLGVQTLIQNVPTYSGLTEWSYDNQKRLTGETSNRLGGWSAAFGYDGSGNPTLFKGQARTYDNQNQLKSGAGLGGFVYDVQGNARRHDGRGITWSADGKPIEFAPAGVGVTTGIPAMRAEYRSDGLRAWKESNFQATATAGVFSGNRRYFLYAGITPIIELDPSGAVVAVNTFGANGLVSRRNGNAISGSSVFYTFDERGSTVQRLDSAGSVLSTRATDAYGITTGTVTTGDPYDGFGAQWGYYTDIEIGLQLCGMRYYDPKVGRWISRDPSGTTGGMNLYGYSKNNPINLVDGIGARPLSSREIAALHKPYRPSLASDRRQKRVSIKDVNLAVKLIKQEIGKLRDFFDDPAWVRAVFWGINEICNLEYSRNGIDGSPWIGNKCNQFVSDAYTLGARVGFPTRRGIRGGPPSANELADRNANWDYLRFPQSEDQSEMPGDIIAFAKSGSGHVVMRLGPTLYVNASGDLGACLVSQEYLTNENYANGTTRRHRGY
jgi:RHS repeat-associated protein